MIPIYRCWYQEQPGYHYNVMKIPDRLMAGVDALACSLEPLIAKHSAISAMIREIYQLQRPK